MYYKVLPPHPDLRSSIGCYWILQTDSLHAVKEEVIIPDGYAEIILNLGASYAWQSTATHTAAFITNTHIVGQRNTSVIVQLPPFLYQVGIKIKPMALQSLLNFPSLPLTNRLIHTEDIPEKAFTGLADKLYEASSQMDQKNILDAYFLQKRQHTSAVDRVTEFAVADIVAKKGLLRMDDLKNKLKIDYRTLERKFKTNVGLTPKEFARVIRFKNVYKAFRSNNWQDASFFLDWGYYDQSHYIKEFKQFMGSTPKAYQSGLTQFSDTILKKGLARSSHTSA